jgi:N-methylhydantoinase B
MLAMRERLPLPGMAGGYPGATTEFHVRRADGTDEHIDGHAMNVVVQAGDEFEFRCASGGGWGDPLDRDPGLVARDVTLGRVTAEQAAATYGVVLDDDGRADPSATVARRADLRRDRLERARPAAVPVGADGAVPDGDATALYPGVVQRGAYAVSEASGAVLAVAPTEWLDGCPVLEEQVNSGGLRLCIEAYLDPATGRTLAVDVRPAGAHRTFAARPARWTTAAPAS